MRGQRSNLAMNTSPSPVCFSCGSRGMVELLGMDATSKKLLRRARMRRCHERHVRATKTRRKQGERRSAGEEDGCSTTTQSTIPSLPSLEGSQYLTGREPMLDQRHHKRVARSERCLWDSDVPAVLGRSDEERGYWHRNLSDTAVYVQRQVHDGRRKIKKGTNLVNEEPALPQLSCSAPSPTLSRLVQQKTEGMKLSDAVLEEIKEMSGHLRIVNWLWDSQCVVPHPPNPAPATSGNLVVVRRNSHNWFDQPQLKDIREVLSPISLNSELMSDFEDELTGLI